MSELGRYLNGEPIQARPIGRVDRAWRWCKCKPALAGLGALAAILLLTLGIGGPLAALQQAEIAQEQTENARKQAELRGQADTERRKADTERQKAETAKDEAERQRRIAETREQEAADSADEARQNFKVAERHAYNSDMLLAQRDWEDANIGHLRELLDRYRNRDDLKGFEWGYWNRLVNSDLFTLDGHLGAVYSMSFSPDGKRIVSDGIRDSAVKVWDAQTGQETLTLKGHTEVSCVSFSPDGSRIVSGGADLTVKVWDARPLEKSK